MLDYEQIKQTGDCESGHSGRWETYIAKICLIENNLRKTRHDLVIDSTSQVSVLTKNQCVFRHVADISGEGSHHRAQYRR